jgi:hypothetical protein
MKNKKTISILIALLLIAITFSAKAQNTISPEFAKFWSELQKDKKAVVGSYLNDIVIDNGSEGQYIAISKPNSINKKEFAALKKVNINKIEMSKDVSSKFSGESVDIMDTKGKKLMTSLPKNVFKDSKIIIESEFYSVQLLRKNYGLDYIIFAKVKGVFKIVMLEYLTQMD